MEEIIEYLEHSDPSVRYRLHRDILKSDIKDLEAIQNDMKHFGWGYTLMSFQMDNSYWYTYYQPKWISTHYTLQTLRCLNYPKTNSIEKAIQRILLEDKCGDGGISPSRTKLWSDCCVNGMFLNFACYYNANAKDLESIIDYLIKAQIKDGGFNCSFYREKVNHSAFNSTLCVIEGLYEYEVQGYKYKIDEVKRMRIEAEEFLLIHQLYISDKTSKIIDDKYCSMHFPYYWRYDLLRALEYFSYSNHPYDGRLEKALVWLESKHKNYRFKLNAQYSGLRYFEMEKAGKESRMITVRAISILNYYNRMKINEKGL